MKKSITVRPKRGRPATGKDPLISARFPEELTAQIDNFAKIRELSRSEAIRRLVELGLKTKAK
jgi:Arc/MetJ-type ribon-helix-helix transcriptional regulator